ncbi:MAG: protein-L-isoaspartate(D-aspartate) O-methyltransferase [Planctomycetota bacterium]
MDRTTAWFATVALLALLLGAWFGFGHTSCVGADARTDTAPSEEELHRRARQQMVDRQIQGRGIRHQGVLAAMRRIPRHRFVPESLSARAYNDGPLPIGHDQTISQPYVVAFMTEALELGGDEKVLEIGTGSGYQAAILGQVARQVFTIEIVDPLAKSAGKLLAEMGYENIHVRSGDGYRGWPEKAPFDAIMVTAAPDHVPKPLVDQLRVGGRMILPVGDYSQELMLIRKTKNGIIKRSVLPVRFVPMTGEAQKR